MYRKRKALLLFSFILFFYPLAHTRDLKSDIKSVIENARFKRPYNTEILDYSLNKEPEDFIKAVFPHLNDSSPDVRLLAINLFGRAGKIVTTKAIRQEVVNSLVNACNDKNQKVRNEAINKLKHFNKEDFNDQSKDKILGLIQNREILDKTFIRIAGMINPTGVTIVLNNILADTTIKNRELKWNIQLALARAGNKAAADYCLNFVSGYKINEQIVYELFPDLIYTRTYESMQYLVKVLNSDEKNCRSSNADNNEKIPCAYRIMEYLAPVIEYYPHQTNASGDIKTNDYTEALKTAREWFSTQDGRYIINNSTF